MGLGAKGVINRKDFNCWGQLPEVNGDGFKDYMKETRKFGKAIWEITGKGNDVDFVFEHPGEATFPVSCNIVKRGGMVVFCAGTTGFNLTMDARLYGCAKSGFRAATLQTSSKLVRPTNWSSSAVLIRACPKFSRGKTFQRHTQRCATTT